MGQAETKSESSQNTRGQLQEWREEHAQGSSADCRDVVQLVLVGPKGSGKSSSGNRILGREAFKAGTTTLICQAETCKIEDHALIIVDTPGLTGKKKDQDVIRGIKKACQDLLDLPVVFLLVVPMGWSVKNTQDYEPVFRQALGILSPDFVMVLLTRADQIQQEGAMEESILRKGGLLQLTTGRCGGWSNTLNIAESGCNQILELLKNVDKMMLDGNPKEQSGRKEKKEKLDKPQTLEEGADYCVAISYQRRRVQKRVEVIKNSERIIAENKGLLRKLRDDIDTLEEDLKVAVGEEQTQALVEKIQVKAADVQAKEDKIQLHIGILQTLQQQVEEKRQLICEMQKEYAKTMIHQSDEQKGQIQKNPPEASETAGQIFSIKENLQKLEDQMKSQREEEEEKTRGRNLEYRAQLQKIKEKMVA